MDTSSLVDSLVSETDLAEFREIFDHASAEQQVPLSDSLPPPANSTAKNEDIDAFRMKVIISAVIVCLVVVTIFLIVPLVSFVYNNNSQDSKKSTQSAQNHDHDFIELTMHPKRGSNIGVFILRSTQPPPAILADTSLLFEESD